MEICACCLCGFPKLARVPSGPLRLAPSVIDGSATFSPIADDVEPFNFEKQSSELKKAMVAVKLPCFSPLVSALENLGAKVGAAMPSISARAQGIALRTLEAADDIGVIHDAMAELAKLPDVDFHRGEGGALRIVDEWIVAEDKPCFLSAAINVAKQFSS